MHIVTLSSVKGNRRRKGSRGTKQKHKQKPRNVKLCVFILLLIRTRQRLFDALLLSKHLFTLTLEGEMLTSLTCPCEIKKRFGKSNDSMNIKQKPHTEA